MTITYKDRGETLMFSDIKIERNKCYYHKSPIFKIYIDTEKVLVSNKIFFWWKKTITTLLVTCMMIIKLNHFI